MSVVNALSDRLVVEVARNRQLWRQEYLARPPAGTAARRSGAVPNRRGTTVTFHPDAEIFGASAHFKPARLPEMVRSKAYLFSGVEIRWKCDPACIAAGDDTPEAATFHFPGGLADYLGERLDGAQCYADRPFAGKVEFAERFGAGHRRLGRVGGELDAAARRLRLLLLQHHPDAGGRHPRGRGSGRRSSRASAATASWPRTARRRRSAART